MKKQNFSPSIQGCNHCLPLKWGWDIKTEPQVMEYQTKLQKDVSKHSMCKVH